MEILSTYLVADLHPIIHTYYKDKICPHCYDKVEDYRPCSILNDGQFDCIYCIECLVNGCKKSHLKQSLFCSRHVFLENTFSKK